MKDEFLANDMFKEKLKQRELILYKNNSYDFVKTSEIIWIATGYNIIQCEQLSLFVITNGFATIKKDHIYNLIPIAESLELNEFTTFIL